MGPLDTLNSVLINSMVFAFVPMLTACQGEARTALFLKLNRSVRVGICRHHRCGDSHARRG